MHAYRTRNPGNNPSTSWAGLFTVSGCELTTGPNGNGIAQMVSTNQFTFIPNDPAQVRQAGERDPNTLQQMQRWVRRTGQR